MLVPGSATTPPGGLETRFRMRLSALPARPCLVAFVLVLLLAPAAPRLAAQSASALTPEQQNARRDHQRLMDLLGIKQLRPPVGNNQPPPYRTNFDESKANVYPTLPDALRLNDGQPVTTPKIWFAQRRPQLLQLFSREIVGRLPPNVPKVTWTVLNAEPGRVADIPVLIKKLQGHVDNSAWPAITVNIDLTLTTPINAGGPVPVIMELAFDAPITANILARPGNEGPSAEEQLISRGWGYAVLMPTSVQPDNSGKLEEGIIGLTSHGRPRKVDDWGCLRAWAWGASRAMDYFETDPTVDARQVGIEGHSRFGKTALVAMAYDQRFAIAYISSSGEGGAKLYRHIYGEELSNLTGVNEFHWFAGNLMKYAGPLTTGDLPIDAHELIGLCAPRPVFIGGGDAAPNMDGWADPKGMFLAAVAAGPVYRLLGKKDLGTTVFPPITTPLISGDIAYRQHQYGHTPMPNWPTFLDFASRYLHAPPAKKP